ncbi:F0F1 ATP synthase subunit delta [Actinotalea sp. Marseille-Q4924]|uniref:F0F1 ATP synthase subunit delta n=1 Tax=Actinotalea sp. Marseille-Q4924 TaxID=2866571 RepID=UPI001CE43B67|nr:F0F1 ATP synthase subunit delta [Actinotalea sp. Marseille-Q4924]
MRGTSLASYESVASAFEGVLAGAGQEARTLGEQLFSVVDALDASGSLRRALGDPSRGADDKARLASTLLSGKVDDRVVEVVQGLARSRWTAEVDLTTAAERLASQAYLAAAQSDGSLEQVEDELFRLERVLVGNRELRQALRERRASPANRRALVVDLLGAGRVHPVTLELVSRSVGTPRERSVVAALAELGRLAAERRSMLVADVTAAVPLSLEQEDRLVQILQRLYGRPVTVNIAVDPAVVGGISVRVGDDLVDSTVVARLDEVRRRLAG